MQLIRKSSKRIGAIAVVAASVFGFVGAGSASAASRPKPPPLPTPTNVVVSKVTAHTVSINIGGATATKSYAVYANGQLASSNLPDASLTILAYALNADTTYAIQVQQYDGFLLSALSKPVTIRTGTATPIAAPTNLRVVSATPNSITVAWDEATPNTSFNIYLDGVLAQGSYQLSATVEDIIRYPNNACPCVMPGKSIRIGVRAFNDFYGAEQSATTEISAVAPLT